MGHGQGGHTHRNQTARTSDRHPLLRKYSTAPVHFIECVIILFFYFFFAFSRNFSYLLEGEIHLLISA